MTASSQSRETASGSSLSSRSHDTSAQDMHTVVREVYFSRQHLVRVRDDTIRIFPLLATLIAPLSVLYDIPALSQPWYGLESQPLTDQTTSLILSSISLLTNIVANLLLLVRFSIDSRRGYTLATRVSLLFWVIKVIVAVVNLILFGASRNNSPGYTYLQGFWCAIVSCGLASISALMLLMHYIYEFDPAVALKNNEIRLRGRGFMLNVTWFITSIGVQGLVLSRIEHWTYLDGLYFSTVSILTVGFGDLSPTTTAGKIVQFPLVLVGIAQLAVVVTNIIEFFAQNTFAVARASQQIIDRERVRKELAYVSMDINDEFKHLAQAQKQEDNRRELINLAYSLTSFMLLWLIGALIFSKLEGWTYGNGLYFNYVFFLTLGYGDYSPSTAAARPVFILYALLAVPIITGFAVQSVTKAMSILSERRLARHRSKVIKPANAVPHHVLLDQATEDLVSRTHMAGMEELLIDTVLQLDLTSRKIFSQVLTGRDRLVMKADTLVQLRNTEFDPDRVAEHFGEVSVPEQLETYRRLFATFLATASAVKKLEGEERRLFERRVRERAAELVREVEADVDAGDGKEEEDEAASEDDSRHESADEEKQRQGPRRGQQGAVTAAARADVGALRRARSAVDPARADGSSSPVPSEEEEEEGVERS